MWVEYSNNPVGQKVGDCAVRAISKALNMGWEAAYIALAINGLQMGDLPNSNNVIGSVLRQHGFKRTTIPNSCPDCYTIKDFCMDNPEGTFVVGTNNHVVAIKNGDYFDIWDSGKEVPYYVWFKEYEPTFDT